MFNITFSHLYLIIRISIEQFSFASVILWIGLYLSCKALYDYVNNFEECIKNKELLTYSLGVVAITLGTIYYYYNKYNLDNPLIVSQWELYFKAKALLGF